MAHKLRTKGSALLILVMLFLFASLTILLTTSGVFIAENQAIKNFEKSRLSLISGETALEEVIYRLSNSRQVSAPETLTINGTSVTVSQSTENGQIVLSAEAANNLVVRKTEARLETGEGVAFFYGVQSGTGGLVLENSSSIRGNAQSNGTITGSGNYIYGSAISSGPTGLIDNIHATSSAYAHSIEDSVIDANAYYYSTSTLQRTTVGGVKYPNSIDPATSTMPIPDSMIDEWKDAALAGGLITTPCPYTIASSTSLGPVKINCNVTVSGTAVITLNGPVWITGNLTLQNSTDVRTGSGIGSQSIAIVVDNPSNRLTSSKIELKNTTEFITSTSSSHILLVSMNNSASSGGGEKAIDMSNSVTGRVLLYAPEGEVLIQNSATLKEVTAWRIRLRNSAQVIYESGLANLLFSSGPSGGYTLASWKEIE